VTLESIFAKSSRTRLGLRFANRMSSMRSQGYNVLMLKSAGTRLREVYSAFWFCVLTTAIGSTILSGCATTHADLALTAPSAAVVGVPFTVTATVTYKGKPDTVINNHIHFTSSDPSAILPGDHSFTPADAGSYTWTNGFTLSTPGNQTISGYIVDASGINASATIAVSP